jgi:hypothetical protein
MNDLTITLPKKVFNDFLKATEYFEHAQDEMENYILSQNKNFITRVNKARREHKGERFGSWEKIKSRYGV